MSAPVELASVVREVHLYRRGARVFREAAPPAALGDAELVLSGLPLTLQDDSVRVALVGDTRRTPADVRVELVLPPPSGTLVPPTEEAIFEAVRAIAALEKQLARVDEEQALLAGLSLELPEPREGRPPRPAPGTAWKGWLAHVDQTTTRLVDERATLWEALRDAREARDRLVRARDEARAKERPEDRPVYKSVRLALRGDGPAPTLLRLSYEVVGARWAPSYVLRVARAGDKAELALRAAIAQSTGEAWDRAKLSLSTADLRREQALPELPSLRIGRASAAPPAKGWRPPPQGVDELFEPFDLAQEALPVAEGAALPQGFAVPTSTGGLPGGGGAAKAKGGKKRAKESWPESPPPPPPAPMMPPPSPRPPARPMAAPAPAPSVSRSMAPPPAGAVAPMADKLRAKSASMFGAIGAGSAPRERQEESLAAMPMASMDMDEESGAFDDSDGALDKFDESDESTGVGLRASGVPAEALLRYGELSMTGPTPGPWPRGRLRPLSAEDRVTGLGDEAVRAVRAALSRAESFSHHALSAELPAGCVDPASLELDFDHRWEAEGLVDVPSDGAAHTVPLLAREAPIRTRLVVVPRESTDAVRLATLQNPLQAPLLSGPCEVYLAGEYLTTAPIRTVPGGAELSIGLGVEEALKVARNARYTEEKHGMLGGGLSLLHEVSIELGSRLSAKIEVEVRERLPLVEPNRVKEIEVVEGPHEPKFDKWDQADRDPIEGGRRVVVTLEPGADRVLTFRYTVKIDGKNELVGGNRRD